MFTIPINLLRDLGRRGKRHLPLCREVVHNAERH
jgi:hypothetical protein